MSKVTVIDGVLSPLECEHVIALMHGHLRPSTITTENEADRAFRTSKTCDLSLIDDANIRAIDARICALVRQPLALSEGIQAQRYDVGEQFKPHLDAFGPETLEKFSTPTLGQRTGTVMVYLNVPEAGGTTAFPTLREEYTPVVGRALIWRNLLPDGTRDVEMLHAGLPVIAGFKAVITKWFRAPRQAQGSTSMSRLPAVRR